MLILQVDFCNEIHILIYIIGLGLLEEIAFFLLLL